MREKKETGQTALSCHTPDQATALPFLRWAGSKRRTLGRLKPYWKPSYSRYVEPFAGSASLFFGLQPHDALISDSNVHLIRTYKAIQKSPAEVYKLLSSYDRSPEHYYSMRSQALAVDNDIELAANLIYLNQNCFNGLFRTNKAGAFNVPHSARRVARGMSENDFLTSASLLRRATLISGDFEQVLLSNAKEGDFVYLDPPYAVANVRIFTQYGPASFGLDDLRRLAATLVVLDDRGVKFAVSYADCFEARSLLSAWTIQSHEVMRHISGFAAHRKTAGEIVVTNGSYDA